MTTYTPDTDAQYCCHCGQVDIEHHSDGRCYTDEEMLSRLLFMIRTGAWPAADEGCHETEDEGEPGTPPYGGIAS